ncbi:hypothetical protein BCR44DRAFT_1438259 [Catenaria anguillulae PL171]|uniref:Uncharacterized protein n=1 Tax=Catenaria anguillulae PL171 TaxID=765915 RepID=A0A1Y2HFL7_9FUNG|nr:hypothetical protein BCR44DRAFT_1438259 [Catenaria anguillulae PL171]
MVQACKSLVLSRCTHHFDKSTIRNRASISRRAHSEKPAKTNAKAKGSQERRCCFRCRCSCRCGSVHGGACCRPTAFPACVAQRGHHDNSALERAAERVWVVKWLSSHHDGLARDCAHHAWDWRNLVSKLWKERRAEQLVSGVVPRECRGIGLEIGHGCEWEWLLAWILGHLPRYCTFSIV